MGKPKRSLEDTPSTNKRNINPISEELAELATSPQQSRINAAKASAYAFNVDDMAYRMREFHPEITREQVDDVYRTTPVIASDRSKGRTQGVYNDGGGDSSRSRIMIYQPDAMSDYMLQDVLGHESNHAVFDKLYKRKLTEKEKEYLNNAYPEAIFREDASSQEERHAVNKQMRNFVSELNGGVTGEGLDRAIEEVPDDVLMEHYFKNMNTGYTNDYNNGNYLDIDPYKGVKFMKTADGKWDSNKVKNIRKAMKHVAFTPTNKRSLSGKNNINLS